MLFAAAGRIWSAAALRRAKARDPGEPGGHVNIGASCYGRPGGHLGWPAVSGDGVSAGPAPDRLGAMHVGWGFTGERIKAVPAGCWMRLQVRATRTAVIHRDLKTPRTSWVTPAGQVAAARFRGGQNCWPRQRRAARAASTQAVRAGALTTGSTRRARSCFARGSRSIRLSEHLLAGGWCLVRNC